MKTLDQLKLQAQSGGLEAVMNRVFDYTMDHASQLPPSFVEDVKCFALHCRWENERVENWLNKTKRIRHGVGAVNEDALTVDRQIYHLPVMAPTLNDWEKVRHLLTDINITMKFHPLPWDFEAPGHWKDGVWYLKDGRFFKEGHWYTADGKYFYDGSAWQLATTTTQTSVETTTVRESVKAPLGAPVVGAPKAIKK